MINRGLQGKAADATYQSIRNVGGRERRGQ